jgi:geranylgeranyl reductase family protein
MRIERQSERFSIWQEIERSVYDVIISGAGPAGSVAAYHCARLGMNTLLLERGGIPRPKCCAGGMLLRALSRLPFALPSEVVQKEIKGFVMQIGDHRRAFEFQESVGVVVKREMLDSFLAKEAEKAGATLWTSAGVSDVAESESQVRVTTSKGVVEGRTMIVAEGATSRSARQLFGEYPKEQLAMGVATDVTFASDTGNAIEIHLIGTPTAHYRFRTGFPLNGWMFPHKMGANIGAVGLGATKKQLHDSVEMIKKYAEARYGTIMSSGQMGAHPIPIAPRKVRHSRRALAVGDAAGLTNPITGEGMTYAFTSGKLAAQSVKAALERGNTHAAFGEYDALCREAMIKDLQAAALLSPILHRLVGVVDTRKFLENFHDEDALVKACLSIAQGQDNWQLLARLAIPRFPRLFFSSLR